MLAYTDYSLDARIRREAETLVLHGFDVIIFVPKEGKEKHDYELGGVNVQELDIAKYQGKKNTAYLMSYVRFTLWAFLKCSALFFSRKLDIFHAHNMPDFLVFAGVVPKLFGKKVILDIHDSMPETYITKFDNANQLIFKILCWEEALCCKLANRVVCVNHPQGQVLAARGIPDSKICISMNVPDHRRFNLDEKKKHPKNNDSQFKLIYHGTQAKRLGVDLTIRAVARLTEEISDLKFYNFGTGDDLDAFIGLSESLGMENHIDFSKVNVHIEKLMAILSQMDIGVVANRKNKATELMLPVKMLEYVALDIPVVAPRLKTIQYYFSEDMVAYFDAEDVDSLSAAIMGLYKNEKKRKKQVQAARRFIERYGWENHQFDLIDMYNEL